jgi:hypothetical protein
VIGPRGSVDGQYALDRICSQFRFRWQLLARSREATDGKIVVNPKTGIAAFPRSFAAKS